MQVFGQFEFVISIFSVGLLNTKGDMQALSSLSLNCSDHKLTQPLMSLPMAFREDSQIDFVTGNVFRTSGEGG